MYYSDARGEVTFKIVPATKTSDVSEPKVSVLFKLHCKSCLYRLFPSFEFNGKYRKKTILGQFFLFLRFYYMRQKKLSIKPLYIYLSK